jgi:hypothetical protein
VDWIERLLHVSPDGGSGSLEWALLLGAATIVGGTLHLLRRHRRR